MREAAAAQPAPPPPPAPTPPPPSPRQPSTSRVKEETKQKPRGCSACGTHLEMEDGTITCLHILESLKFRQIRSMFYRQNGERHQVVDFKMPRWLFPKMRRTVEKDSVDGRLMSQILVQRVEIQGLINKKWEEQGSIVRVCDHGCSYWVAPESGGPNKLRNRRFLRQVKESTCGGSGGGGISRG